MTFTYITKLLRNSTTILFCFRIIQNCVFEEAHTTLVTIYHWRSVGTEVDIRKGDNMIAIFDIVGIGFITL